MSTFEVKIRKLKNVQGHPNADRLDIAMVDGFRVVVQKGRYVDGDLAIYVPEAAVVPEGLLKPGFWKPCEECHGQGFAAPYDSMPCEKCKGAGGKGMLSGPKGNRVKAVKLRGTLSQGILLDLGTTLPNIEGLVPNVYARDWREGDDVAGLLGITKYEPEIPAQLSGQVYTAPGITTYTDIENYKRFPNVLQDGEEVVMSEKLHGTCLIAFFDGEQVHVSSKGVSGKGLALEDEREPDSRSRLTRARDFVLRRPAPELRRTNFYWRCLESVGGIEALNDLAAKYGGSVTLYGEALPAQDLTYNFTGNKPTMRAFDLKIGSDYVNHDIFEADMRDQAIPTVPILYYGEFSQEALDEHTTGKTTLDAEHVREGVVVKPVVERQDPELGRVILKSISEKYLTRKNATEFN